MRTDKSQVLFQRGISRIPGGVNSPVRAWRAVGGNPLFMSRGRGSAIFDADGNRYIDYVCSWGPLILGHAPAKIVQAVRRQAAVGSTFGAPTAAEVDLAEMVSGIVPSVEKVRLVNSGTEATMTAIRLARAYTGKAKVVKFDGCYHGHADGLLVKAGSGVATLGLPDSPGVPPSFAKQTLIASYNDIASVQAIFARHGQDVAAVIVEPVCGNMGVIPPARGFLRALRRITQRYRALLIFDEVITGFRVALGGAQELYGVKPDLTCLGKILGGGFPLAAFGGRKELMDLLAPAGPVYQAGTLSGNPVAVAAGLETLQTLRRPGTYTALEEKSKRLEAGFDAVLKKYRIRAAVNRVGSMLTLFFGVDRVTNAVEARQCDRKRFARYFHGMLERGVYLPPAPFEAMFVSLAHSNADLQNTIAAFADWAREETSV
ncbi:MAG TPA: glutamate-1-semialdehyde 2,1-aminomutase [Candidatus Binatia bacterium]|nr:glutamate-1-semialdehyde 2,1-aminomutase [Candidatus Binatia bacterium]